VSPDVFEAAEKKATRERSESGLSFVFEVGSGVTLISYQVASRSKQ